MELTANIAARINSEHAKATGAANSAIEHAIIVGGLLAEAKASIEHGKWLSWVGDNLDFGERQARSYMRVFGARDQIGSQTSDLTIDGFLDSIATPKPAPKPKADREPTPATTPAAPVIPVTEQKQEVAQPEPEPAKVEPRTIEIEPGSVGEETVDELTELRASNKAMGDIFNSDDRLAEATAECERLRQKCTMLQSRVDGLLIEVVEKNKLLWREKSMKEKLQRQIGKLEAESACELPS